MGGRAHTALACSLAAVLAIAAPASAATIEVTTTNDELDLTPDATCSLREAVRASNQNGASGGCPKGQQSKTDVIELGAESYELTLDGSLENGDLDYTGGGPLTIRGDGSTSTEISGSFNDRVLEASGAAQKLVLEKLEVADGVAPPASNGGNLHVSKGKLVLRDVLSTNSGATSGGAIAASSEARLQVNRSIVSGGKATLGGGGIALFHSAKAVIKESSISGNRVDSTGPGTGGAISGVSAGLRISDSVFFFNAVDVNGSADASGGAIFSQGPLSVQRSLFQANSVDSSNSANEELGGALVHLALAPAEIVNSTFVDNEAPDQGGAYWTNGGETTLSHITFDANDAADGDHLFAGHLGLIEVKNSIIPSPLAGDACGSTPDVIKSKGYNLFNLQDPECAPKAKDEIVSDVGLDPDGLEENGGPTPTLGLLKTSEAVDLIPVKKCASVDQRGFDRPKGPKCDAGAVERGAKP